ncbi:hypothetical protein [Paenibacillus puldeungensis]|uniref:hypothetical protein n=1 Tax=Paenibacillus puldeungensis TaxID=696536 RepID=UPI0036D2B270
MLTASFSESLFTGLYWFGMIAMSLVLIGVTVTLFWMGIQMLRSKSPRKGLAIGCIVFSLTASCMIALMVDKQFF